MKKIITILYLFFVVFTVLAQKEFFGNEAHKQIIGAETIYFSSTNNTFPTYKFH